MGEPSERRRWRGLCPSFWETVACLGLVALTWATFSNALFNGFVSFDDWLLIETNERIRALPPHNIVLMLVSKDPNSHAWLPLRELSYAVDYHFWGLLPTGYHLTNLLLHTANVLLAYIVLKWLVRRPVLALLGAAWFAVHPAQVESVTWASGRRDVLYAFFFLLSFLAFLAYERQTGRRRWVWYAASLVCLTASLLSKSSAMTLPAVLTLAVLAFGESGDGLWRRMAATAPHWGIAVGLTAVHVIVAHEAGVVKGQALSSSLASVPLIFAEYWRLLFFPIHLATPHGTAALKWATDGTQIAWLAAATIAIVAAAWWAAPRRSLALFCLGWWFLLLLPVANLVPLSVLVAERYLYLPLLGACGFGAELLGRLATGWRRPAVVACALLSVTFLAIGTRSRNRAWENGMSFWQDGVSKWPDIPVTRIGIASEYAEQNQLERAWEEYMTVVLNWGRAASRHPDHLSLINAGLDGFYDRLARSREAQGHAAGALEVYETVARLMPDDVRARVRLAHAYERWGMWDKALEQAKAVQAMDPKRVGIGEWVQRLEARAGETAQQGPKE